MVVYRHFVNRDPNAGLTERTNNTHFPSGFCRFHFGENEVGIVSRGSETVSENGQPACATCAFVRATDTETNLARKKLRHASGLLTSPL